MNHKRPVPTDAPSDGSVPDKRIPIGPTDV